MSFTYLKLISWLHKHIDLNPDSSLGLGDAGLTPFANAI
jgi:hypothetical protein